MRVKRKNEWLRPVSGVCAGALPVFLLFAVAANMGCQGEPTLRDGPQRQPPGVEIARELPRSCPAFAEPHDGELGRRFHPIGEPQLLAAEARSFPIANRGMVELTGLWAVQSSFSEPDAEGRPTLVSDYRAVVADGSCLAISLTIDVGERNQRNELDELDTLTLDGGLDHAAAKTGLRVRGLQMALWDVTDATRPVWSTDVLRSHLDPEVRTVLTALHTMELAPIDGHVEAYSHDCGCSGERQRIRDLHDALQADLLLYALGVVICVVSGILTGPGGIATFLACMAVITAVLSIATLNLLRDLQEALNELNCCSHTTSSIVRAGVPINCVDTNNVVAVIDGDGDRYEITVEVPDPLNPGMNKEIDCCYYYPGQDSEAVRNPPCIGSGCGGGLCGQRMTDAMGNETIQQCPMGPCEGRFDSVPEGACETATGQAFAQAEGIVDPVEIQNIINGLKRLKKCQVFVMDGAAGEGLAPALCACEAEELIP